MEQPMSISNMFFNYLTSLDELEKKDQEVGQSQRKISDLEMQLLYSATLEAKVLSDYINEKDIILPALEKQAAEMEELHSKETSLLLNYLKLFPSTKFRCANENGSYLIKYSSVEHGGETIEYTPEDAE